MKQRFLGLLVLFYFLLPSGAVAMNPGVGPGPTEISGFMPMSLHLSVEYLQGKSNEYVYDSATGQKISQLDWDLKNIVLVGGVFNIELADHIHMNFSAWTAVNNGDGQMIDRDWETGNTEWSDWSLSSAMLDKGYILDINASFPFTLKKGFVLSPQIGFKFDNWKWSDWGGQYIYSRNGGWRNVSGAFKEETGIRYEQKFFAPYLGLCLDFSYKNFFVNTYVKGSLWAWSKGRDQHLYRNLVFEDEIDNQAYIGAGLEVGYLLTRHFYMMVGYDYQKFFETTGDSKFIDLTDNSVGYDPNSAGTGHHAGAISFSLGYRF